MYIVLLNRFSQINPILQLVSIIIIQTLNESKRWLTTLLLCLKFIDSVKRTFTQT